MRTLACLAILTGLLAQMHFAAYAGEPPEAEARKKRVAELIAQLNDKDCSVRGKAAEVLGNFTSEEGVFPALVKLLHDPDSWPRSKAAASLSGMGPEAAKAFAETLQDKSPGVREMAALGLCWMAERAAPAKDALLKALEDENARARDHAAVSLARIPQAKQEFLKAFSDPRVTVRAAITRALPDSGEENYGLLAKAVSDPEVSVRMAAVGGLSRLVEDADLVIPPLVTALGDADKGVRVAAMAAIGQVKQGSPEVIEGVRKLLADPDAGLRAAAAGSLAGMGAKAATAGADLIKALSDENQMVREAAAYAVGTACPTRESAPALLKALQDKEYKVRAMAVLGMGKPDAGPEAVAAILGSLKDEWSDVRRRAATALGVVGPKNEAATAALVALVEGGDKSSEVRQAAADALHRFGGEKGTVQALAKALKDRDLHVRSMTAWSLARIGPQAREATGALLAAIDEEPAWVRLSVMNALGAIGAEKGVVPALIKALGDKEWEVRERACGALGRIGGPAAEALPALEKALTDESAEVRKLAAYAIGKIKSQRPRPPEPEVF